MLKFLVNDRDKLKDAIKTETDNFTKLTAERTTREALKKAKQAAQAKEKEFGDADGHQKRLRDDMRKAESELEGLRKRLTKAESSGT